MGKIYIVGDLILDEYWDGDIIRMSQEAPVPIFNKKKNNLYKLGCAGNVALNVKALGEDVVLIAPISNDNGGKILRELLDKNNIKYLEQKNYAETIRKIRVQTSQQQIIRIDNDNNHEQKPIQKDCYRFLINKIKNDDIVVVSDYGKGAINEDLSTFLKELRNLGIKNIVDPKGTKADIYKGAFLIKPNLAELEKFSHKNSLFSSSLTQIKQKFEFTNILLTMGAEGMIVMGEDLLETKIEAIESPIFDTTGVGDNICAAIAVALLRGKSLLQSCHYANVIASLAIMHKGCHAVTVNELSNVQAKLLKIEMIK